MNQPLISLAAAFYQTAVVYSVSVYLDPGITGMQPKLIYNKSTVNIVVYQAKIPGDNRKMEESPYLISWDLRKQICHIDKWTN